MNSALRYTDIDFAVKSEIPVTPQDDFYVDLSDVRGYFKDELIYQSLGVHSRTFKYMEENPFQKHWIFLSGNIGAGKTTQINKWIENLNNSDCFLCIFVEIDRGLDMNNIEYTDVVIYQFQKLFQKLYELKISLDDIFVNLMVSQLFNSFKEIENQLLGVYQPHLLVDINNGMQILHKLFIQLRTVITSSVQKSVILRNHIKTKFEFYAQIFNTILEAINHHLRKQHLARELFFVIDGFERTVSGELRRKIFMEEYQRISQIKVNTLFTLPIELMKDTRKLKTFGDVYTFPCIKLYERNGKPIESSYRKLEELLFRRVDKTLFDSQTTIREAIFYSGGSPRELLRIIENATFFIDPKKGIIDNSALKLSIKKLAAVASRFITELDIQMLKKLKELNKNEIPVINLDEMQELLEKMIVFEYEDGTHKRVNPLVEISNIYKYHVG